MAHLLGTLAAWAAAHWKRSLAIVAVVLVALGLAAGAGGGSFVDDFKTPGTESQTAIDVLDKRFPAASGDTANVVFAVESGTLREPERRAAIERTIEEIRAQPHVTGAPSPFAKDSGQLSEDARIAYVPVQYDDTASALGKEPGERLEQASELGDRAGLEVSRNGAVVDQAEQTTAPVGELIGVAVAIIVLTLVFRSVAAMALTLISALIALAGGLLLLQFASAFADFPSFAPTLGVMLGLGAGIDYALLIVGRYREQLASGDSVGHSARVANATAGTSVVAAGAIVVVAIAGLLATGIPFVGTDGDRLGDHHRHGRRGRGHRAAHADGRLRPPAAPQAARARGALAALRALGRGDHAPAARGRDRGRARARPARHAARLAAPRPARRRQRQGRLDHPRRLRPALPRASAPASTDRSSWPPPRPRTARARPR